MAEIRAFIAISLPPLFQSNLERISKQLREQLPSATVRWVPVKNIHLTLKFLGNVPEQDLELLQERIKVETARHPRFEFALGQPGAFPSISKPRVVWVGVTAVEDLRRLAKGIEQQAALLGYPPEERPFSPHLTLGRVARQVTPGEIRMIGEAIRSTSVDAGEPFQVSEIHLIRSDLHATGAVYTLLFSASLA